MSLKRQLCQQHAEKLRTTKLFGGKPTEQPIAPTTDAPCGIETSKYGGRTTQKRVVKCDLPAEFLFSFGKLRPVENIRKKH
jgi:hypothetical protein